MELKNIKYQTMLLNNNSKIFETKPNVLNIQQFLDSEKELNKNKPWSKLNKGTKLKDPQKKSYFDDTGSAEPQAFNQPHSPFGFEDILL